MDSGRGYLPQIPDRGQYVHSSHRSEVEEVGLCHKGPLELAEHINKTSICPTEGEEMTHRMIRGRPWTPEEDVLLRDLAAIGKNVRAIANEMNRSEAGVRKRAKETAVNIVNARRLKARPME
jgi:hypothetical protein